MWWGWMVGIEEWLVDKYWVGWSTGCSGGMMY